MASAKWERLIINSAVPPHFATEVAGLWNWFKIYAEGNFPNEELAPGADGLPPTSQPILEKVKKVYQVDVYAISDLGRGYLRVDCEAHLSLAVNLYDAAETIVTIDPIWKLNLPVDPAKGRVVEHNHGWEEGFLPDP